MAKQRNSLGVLVLPAIEETMTFAEYEQRFGIDLSKIFKINSAGLVIIDSSKLILLDANPGKGFGYYPKLQYPAFSDLEVDGHSITCLWQITFTNVGPFGVSGATGMAPNPFTKEVIYLEF